MLTCLILAAILVPPSLAGVIGHQYWEHHGGCMDADDTKAACSWLLDLDSPYSECMSLMNRDKVMQLYALCRTKFCQDGKAKVCALAIEVSIKCENYMKIDVDGAPDGCHENCPNGDKTRAQVACSWIIDDSRSPYRECLRLCENKERNIFFDKCVAQYCMSGDAGMCEVADTVGSHCQVLYFFPIFERLPQCENVQTPAPLVTPFPDGSQCDDEPEKDADAIKACAWVKDPDSPFAECYASFDEDKQIMIYDTCLKIYCYRGNDGVCYFADNLAGVCKERFDLVIKGRPKFCPRDDDYCTAEDPLEDLKARASCAWFKDPDSPFAGCFTDIGSVDDMYEICVNAYCRKGIDGVCWFAKSWADKCEEVHGICIDEPPIDCPVPATGHVYCYGEPEENPAAHDACRWLAEIDSPYHECVDAMGCKDVHLLYTTCLQVYCDKVLSGVCIYAEHIAEICHEKHELTVGKLDMCDDVDAEQSFCEGDHIKDRQALYACSWLLDRTSPYYECMDMIDIKTKSYIYCVHKYCKYGLDGVCKLARTIAGQCPRKPGLLPQCGGCECSEAMVSEKGEAACSWVTDVDSPFHACAVKMKPGHLTKWYKGCLMAYCNEAQDGVCDFAHDMAYACIEKYHIPVGSYEDMCPHPTTTEAPVECTEEDAGTNEAAIEACSWVIDTDSPFHTCVSKLELGEIKKWHKACLVAFCKIGRNGVCDFAKNVAHTCQTTYHTAVGSFDDICEGTTRLCTVAESGTNKDAIIACSWVIDLDSRFHDCVSSRDLVVIKKWYKDCLKAYCRSGYKGVCYYADQLADICDGLNYNVAGYEDICIPPTSEPTTTVFSFCVDAPEVDENAIEACQWLWDETSLFYECLSGNEYYHMVFYRRCLEAYCYSGLYGVCWIAMDIAGDCEKYHDICITDAPEVCGNPDENKMAECNKKKASAKCGFIIEVKSKYYDCLKDYDCDELKESYDSCVDDYCCGDGVCKVADSLADKCHITTLDEC